MVEDIYCKERKHLLRKMADERKELDWDLSINVPVKGITRKLRVTSNESVQAIILKVASKLGKISNTTRYIV